MTLKTKRLLLRPMRERDAVEVHEYAGDKGITMMLFLPNDTFEETLEFARSAEAEWKKQNPQSLEFVIEFNKKIIGGIGLEFIEDGAVEIGWVVRADFRGRGFATEAALAVKDYAFRELGARKIIAHCDSKNTASFCVMKKIGMSLIDKSGTRTYPKTGAVSGEFTCAVEKDDF